MNHLRKFATQAIAIVSLAASCYSPIYPEGRQCAPDGSCPGDLVCDQFFQCLSPELVQEPIEPTFPPNLYGQLCWEGDFCAEGMDCFIDYNNGFSQGFCTPVCGDGSGMTNEEVCQFVDPGFGATHCLLSEYPPELPPMYCATECDVSGLCPDQLECMYDDWFGISICKPSF